MVKFKNRDAQPNVYYVYTDDGPMRDETPVVKTKKGKKNRSAKRPATGK
jgi:hypothetical protein